MIREMLEYCLTPASFHARRTGYLYEAIAFESRARRNEKYWRPHWKICQNLVENFLAQNSKSKSLVIFGSGCLFEIPKDKMVQQFDQILLVDQVFPRSVRAWSQRQNSQIELIECDLSRSFPKNLKADLALSSNLLSQLSLPAPDRKQEIEEKHLQDLKSLHCPVLLWTDYEKIFRNSETREIIHQLPTVLTDFGPAQEEWIWNLAPAPEWDKEVDVFLKMAATVF